MFKNQRHEEILEILKNESFAGVCDLSKRLFASQPTIRRDLDILEKQGYIRRSHGGAILANGNLNTPVPYRKGKRAKEKAQICQLASTLLRPDMLIFTDASTTVLHLSDWINEKDNITVVTNGLSMCRALVERNVNTYSTGGHFFKRSEAFVGRHAEETVNGFNADMMFISVASLDSEGMLSDFSEEELALRLIMKKRCEKTVLLIDSEKIEKKSAFRIFPLSEIDYIVTNTPLSDHLIERYRLTVLRRSEHAILYQNSTLC